MLFAWRASLRASFVVGVVAFLLAVPLAQPADAHAILVSSSPGDGAELELSPSQVTLEFNEPVNASLGGLRVFDGDGARVDRGSVRGSNLSISVDVRPLDDGVYVASYRVISADGHPVRGGIIFSIGDVDTSGVRITDFGGDGSDRGWEVAAAFSRWVTMLGALVAAGGAMFIAFCNPAATPRSSRAVRLAALVGALGVAAAIPAQAALSTGQGPNALFEPGVLRAVLGNGLGWATGTAIAGLCLVAVGVGRGRWLAVGGAALIVASFPMVGHTRFDDVLVGTIADGAHVGAAAVWVGGLALLALTRRDHTSVAERAKVLDRFSTLATVSIIVVGVAGLALAWTEVKALRALTSTDYGLTLLAKVAVVALVAAAGAYNHFRLVPRVLADPTEPAPWRRLKSTLRVELGGIAMVLALTAVLVNLVPAGVAAGIGQIHTEILELGDSGSVQIVVDPNAAGENTIHLYFYGPDGRPADIATDVRLEFTKPGDDIGPIERTPFSAGPGHLQLDSNVLVSSGRWDITIVAQVSRFAQEVATANVLVGS